MNHEKLVSIAIVGAGISGLRAALFIAKNSNQRINKITIFDKQEKIGGVLQHTKSSGYLLEHASQGVLLSREAFQNCLNEVGIQKNVLLPNKKEQTRYLLTTNSCVPLNLNLMKLKKSGILKTIDFIRIFLEVFFRKPIKQNMNETIYAFFHRHFGKKFVDTFLVSLSFGIWGGGSRKLLLRHTFPNLIKLEYGYGSLIRALFFSIIKKLFHKNDSFKKQKGLASFQDGMKFLTMSLYQKLEEECQKNNIQFILKIQTSVRQIEKKNHTLILEYNEISKQNSNIKEEFHSVLYTGQPWRDPNLTIHTQNKEGDEALKQLQKIESHSIAVVGLGGKNPNNYKTSLKGFGALAGEWSKDILGVIFIHSTYPSHVPKESYLYRVMLGGDRDPSINQKSNEALIAIAKKRLLESKVIQEKTDFEFEHVIKWENYIPLPTIHQDKVIEAIWKIEAFMPGLFFTGNYIKGASISDCLDVAESTAKKILDFFGSVAPSNLK